MIYGFASDSSQNQERDKGADPEVSGLILSRTEAQPCEKGGAAQ